MADQGPQGFSGPQGPPGVQGPIGAGGPAGNMGTQGYQGNTGSQGVSGNTGSQGYQGYQGIAGPGGTGPQGVTGCCGPQGYQGNTGPGGTGSQGFQGTQGYQGTTGANSTVQGPQGNQGSTGTGTQGFQGYQGFQGFQGNQGYQGSSGTGTQGVQGSQGSQGYQGYQGFQGNTGSGTQGSQGFQGSTGVGTQGSQGVQGSQGSQGTSGGSGVIGVNRQVPFNNNGTMAGSVIYNNNSNGYVGINESNPQNTLDIGGILTGGTGRSTYRNTINISSSVTSFASIDTTFHNGGLFRSAEVAIINGSFKDVFFQAIPASSSAYGVFEAYQGAGLVLGTGSGFSDGGPVEIRPGRNKVASFSSSGLVLNTIYSDTELLKFQSNTTAQLRDAASFTTGFSNTDDGNRTGFISINAYDSSTVREGFRVSTNGSQVQLGFYGNTPISKPSGNVFSALQNLGLMSSPSLSPANLGTGTANNTTYLRGDGVWSTVSGGGGTQGPQGFQGAAGTGTQGPQGYQGPAGDGSQGGGNQGPQGYQGATGTNGNQGPQGFQGNQGFQGRQGFQGTQGVGVHPFTTATYGATTTFNLTTSTLQQVTLAGNPTLALSNVTSGMSFILILKQDGTGNRTVTWFSGITWSGGVPTLTTTANARDVFSFLQVGTGAYLGFVVGQNL